MRFRVTGHASRFFASGVCAVILACACVTPGSVATAASRSVCAKADITTGLVRQIFGAAATIGGSVYVSEQGRCAIACLDNPPTCATTDVFLYPAKYFKPQVASDIQNLDEFGHARKKAVAGAGEGAVLLTANNYGGSSNPLLVFQAGKYAVTIEGPLADRSETAAVYRQWEKLARAVHSHLG